MAIKRIITKAEHEKLSPQLQSEYKADDTGANFVLDLSDYEDPAALKRAKDHERDRAKTAEQALKTAQDALEAVTTERDGMLAGSIPKADAEKLQKSWQDKLAKVQGDLTAQVTAAEASLQTLLVDNVAQDMASKISTAPSLLLPHIKSRLKAEKSTDGRFETRVLDKEGKPSALTVAELQEEFVVNPDFKAVITGSRASGGGAGGGNGGGGAHGGKIDWSASPKAIAASLKPLVKE